MATQEETDDFLSHHGVLGMHWGKHKTAEAKRAALAAAGPTKHAQAKTVLLGSYGSKSRFTDPAALHKRVVAGKLRIAAYSASVPSSVLGIVGNSTGNAGAVALSNILSLGAGAVGIASVVSASKAIGLENEARGRSNF